MGSTPVIGDPNAKALFHLGHILLNSLLYALPQRRLLGYATCYVIWVVISPLIDHAPRIFGENLSVILNAQKSAADLSKKHVAILFHTVREAIASKSIEDYWIKGKYNQSDIMTKKIPCAPFKSHCDFIYWRANFHLLQ